MATPITDVRHHQTEQAEHPGSSSHQLSNVCVELQLGPSSFSTNVHDAPTLNSASIYMANSANNSTPIASDPREQVAGPVSGEAHVNPEGLALQGGPTASRPVAVAAGGTEVPGSNATRESPNLANTNSHGQIEADDLRQSSAPLTPLRAAVSLRNDSHDETNEDSDGDYQPSVKNFSCMLKKPGAHAGSHALLNKQGSEETAVGAEKPSEKPLKRSLPDDFGKNNHTENHQQKDNDQPQTTTPEPDLKRVKLAIRDLYSDGDDDDDDDEEDDSNNDEDNEYGDENQEDQEEMNRDDSNEDEDQEDENHEEQKPTYTSGPIDEETGQRAAFPIPQLDSSLLRSMASGAAPASALEYLARVRHEASARPSFMHTIRSQPITTSLSTQALQNSHALEKDNRQTLKPYSLPKPAHLPQAQPHNPFVVIPQTNIADQPKDATDPHPIKSSFSYNCETLSLDRKWNDNFLKSFLRSRLLLQTTIDALDPQTISGSIPSPPPETFDQWKKFLLQGSTVEPSPALLSQLDIVIATQLLDYACRCASSKVPSPMARWTFAILLKYPDTVDANDAAVLRQLAKKCIHIRNKIAPGKKIPVETRLWLDSTVAIVADLYGQRDLVNLIDE